MDLPSALAGFVAGAAVIGGGALLVLKRQKSERSRLVDRVSLLEVAEQAARETLEIDNADLRRRLDAVADAVLAKPVAGIAGDALRAPVRHANPPL